MNDRNDLLKKIDYLEQKNNELTLKLSKLEEKDGSHAGSTESFETINDTDRSELIKKIEQLTQENSDLTMKLSRIEEKGSSDTGSTESFERIPEHNDSPTKIELLTQENNFNKFFSDIRKIIYFKYFVILTNYLMYLDNIKYS